jgi:hypothetical protein
LEKKELYQFIACDYYATGEGRSLCLLITRAYPRTEDYETRQTYADGTYIPPKLKPGMSDKVIAAREFIEEFGSYYARCAENLSREEFLKRFGHFVPDVVHKMIESDDPPGNLNFKQHFHFNFS